MMFTAKDYGILSALVFKNDYPGYRKNVIESPNGDGNWDTEKRYAHVAVKYLDEYDPYKVLILDKYLTLANDKAIEIAIALGVPKAFWPDIRYSALRVLEYPPGSLSHPHKDFDLFTLMCYRNALEQFEYTVDGELMPESKMSAELILANSLNKDIHFGEIIELIMPTHHHATEHQVHPCKDITQYSIVYFSIPDHEAVLPNGTTVGKWIDERIGRSRKEAA
jgi:hypothetical protein